MNFHFLYRDATLPEDFLHKYQPGMRILERGYTDTSKLRGGPRGNVRYLILSNKAKDISGLNENTAKWGMVLLEHGTIFTVLDIYQKDGVTQVLLSTEPQIADEDVIIAARQDLDELANQEPVAALSRDDWKHRVVDPIGLDDNGDPFPLT